jgi:hypothetical protein
MTDTDSKKSEPAKNPAPENQSTKPVAPQTELVKDNNPGSEPAKNTTTDNTPAPEPSPNTGSNVTPEEQKALDRLFDDMDEREEAADVHPMKDVMARIRKVVAATTNSPDDHTVWGAAGVKITLGDLRNMVRYGS